MKNALTIILVVFIFQGFLNTAQTEKKAQQRAKTINIGVTTWNTEQVDFKEILAKANKEKKLVLAVFNDAYSPLGKRLKQKLFYNQEVTPIAREAVLYYVEANYPKGMALVEKYKVFQYPTFKLFSAEGKLLHTNYFGFTADADSRDLVDWVYQIKQGRGPGPRQKTVTIGQVKWYTEQNTFEQILAIAKKQKKKVVLVYTDYSDKHSYRNVKDILESESFRVCAHHAVLLNVEKTGPDFLDYMKKFKLYSSPTAILFSQDGKELERDTNNFINTNTFVRWFDDAVSGDNRETLAIKAKKEPENRENLMRLARKMDIYEGYDVVEILQRVIRLNPDAYDPLTQEAYERQAVILFSMLLNMRQAEKKKLTSIFNDDFMNAYYNYYPDQFNYQLKNNRKKYYMPLLWLNTQGKYKEAEGYFNDFTRNMAPAADYISYLWNVYTVQQGILTYLNLDRSGEAETWSEKMVAVTRQIELGSSEPGGPGELLRIMLFKLYSPFVAFHASKGEWTRAEAYADKAIRMIAQLPESNRIVAEFKNEWTRNYGVFADTYLNILDKRMAGKNRYIQIETIYEKAVVLAKTGKMDEAEKILNDLANDPSKGNDDYMDMKIFYAIELIDTGVLLDKAVDLVKESVSGIQSHHGNWFLATTYAAKGDFANALKYLEKALQLAEHENQKEMYRRRLKLWKLFLKN